MNREGRFQALRPHIVRPSLGLAVLAGAEADLANGIVETSPNGGHVRIAQMDAYVGATYGSEGWGAAAVSTWIIEAAIVANRPHSPIAGAKNGVGVVNQLKTAKRWLDAAVVRANPSLLKPGVITAFKANANPGTTSIMLGVLRTFDGVNTLVTLQGDAGPTGMAGDRLRVINRGLADVTFVGIGCL